MSNDIFFNSAKPEKKVPAPVSTTDDDVFSLFEPENLSNESIKESVSASPKLSKQPQRRNTAASTASTPSQRTQTQAAARQQYSQNTARQTPVQSTARQTPVQSAARQTPVQNAAHKPVQQNNVARTANNKTIRNTAAEKQTNTASANGKKPKETNKKKHTLRKVILGIFVFILAAAVFAGGAGLYVLGDYSAAEYNNSNSVDASSLMHSAGVINILLMGVDNADTSLSTRSDAMILLSVDTIHSKLKLTSFMRDMYVNIPGYGYTKLTHACAYEGPQLVADTIETNFNIRIDAYAKIGYSSFSELVDGVGGITVAEIDETEAAALKREFVHIEPGTNIHLNGTEALQYCRIRKGQSDFQRTERQREAITLIVNQMKHTNPFTLLKLAKQLIGDVECSIPKSELISLAFKVLPCILGDVEQAQIPMDGSWANDTRDGMAVLVVDLDQNINFLKEFIY